MSLTVSVSHYTQSRMEKNVWGKLYNDVKKKYNNKCKYCNNTYKFMNCISTGKVATRHNSILCCKLCKMIAQCIYTYQKELVLCWSNEPQESIIKKSIWHIEKFGKIPSITQIDPKAKKLKISLIEYIDLLSEQIQLPFAMSKYKAFLTPYFDFSYMNLKLDNSQAMFVDENENEEDDKDNNENFDLACSEEELIEQDEEYSENYEYFLQKKEPDEHLPIYNFTVNETNLLNKFFDPHTISVSHNTLNMNEINDILGDSIKIHFQDDIEYTLTTDEHHGILMDNWVFGKIL